MPPGKGSPFLHFRSFRYLGKEAYTPYKNHSISFDIRSENLLYWVIMLQEKIKNQIKEAMLAKEPVRLEVLRGMSAAFMNELVSKGKKPQDVLSDEDALQVIMRL